MGGGVAAIMLGVFVLVAPTAGALTSAESIAKLNQQRAANGIPAGIVERPDWSDACRKHDAYTKAHGLTHDEDSSQPDYTPEGAWAGQNAVLSTSNGWGPTSVESTWEHAPIHLMQILGPALSEMGTWGGCATTWPGYNRPFAVKLPATLYLSPAKRRGRYVAFSLKAPGALVGRTATRYVTRTKRACRSRTRFCRRQRRDGRIQVTRRRLAAQQTVKVKRPRRGGRLKLVINSRPAGSATQRDARVGPTDAAER